MIYSAAGLFLCTVTAVVQYIYIYMEEAMRMCAIIYSMILECCEQDCSTETKYRQCGLFHRDYFHSHDGLTLEVL